MAARAIWKGIVRFEEASIPVKLYSAVQDRDVHFRLLHRKDKSPVRQEMIHPQTGDPIPYAETQRAYETAEKDLVIITKEELESLSPEKSRDIDILYFVPERQIDHRWYDRPYYLGPDGAEERYFAFIEALRDTGREGLARWHMRNKEYLGALRLHGDYPLLISLRHAEDVVPVESLAAPTGRALDKKELNMARQLIDMLEAPFEPEAYRNEYRDSVLEMLERKRRGGKVKAAPRPKKKPAGDISSALESSLKRERKRAS